MQNNKTPEKIDLNTFPKEKLLDLRICQLGLSLGESELQPGIGQLYTELKGKGLCFSPPCYLTDEWGCPNLIPAIGIPFYLAHPRLKQLEEEIMLEVEGGSQESFMKFLRHEAGHAYNYAYKLYRRPRWRQLFGAFSKDYNSDIYKPRPYSRRYVRHLENLYAQCHPDEDFAETFAVWLTPDLDWQKKYKGWPALKKLNYLDALMKEISGKTPLVTKTKLQLPAHKIKSRLKTFYEKKRNNSAHIYPDFYDGDLREIFAADKQGPGYEKASVFLKKHREDIMATIAYWTAENKYTINQLLKNLTSRCDELNLAVNRKKHKQVIMDISTYLTTLVMNYYYTGTFVG